MHFLKVPFFFFACLFFTSAHAQQNPIRKTDKLNNPVTAEVIGIQDGDTIELKLIFTGRAAGHRMDKPLRIRLMHINCPERGKPYYKVAKQFTSEMCFRQKVTIRHNNRFDKYGRLIGEVVLADGRVLNKELVKKGFAVHFKKYSDSVEYARLEDKAKKQKLGIMVCSRVAVGTIIVNRI